MGYQFINWGEKSHCESDSSDIIPLCHCYSWKVELNIGTVLQQPQKVFGHLSHIKNCKKAKTPAWTFKKNVQLQKINFLKNSLDSCEKWR